MTSDVCGEDTAFGQKSMEQELESRPENVCAFALFVIAYHRI
jgi:hypothetical protein